jgi:hypothetical protein
MRFKRCVFTFAIWALLLSGVVQAQTSGVAEGKSIPGDVTFEVPLNLTKLWGEITKVAVWCTISSDVLLGTRDKKLGAQLELPVSSGQVVTTARVVVPVPSTAFTDPTMTITSGPTGQPASYQCSLSGFSMLPTDYGGGWNLFNAESKNPAFHLTPTPSAITGSFVW